MRLALTVVFHENSAPFHEACMASVLEQTSKDFVFIMIADEIDISPPVDLPFETVFREVKGLRPRDIKAQAIRIASEIECDFVCFLDSDDTMRRDRMARISEIIPTLQSKDAGLIHNMIAIDEGGIVLHDKVFTFTEERLDRSFFSKHNASGFGNTVYRTRQLEKIIPFPEPACSLDWEIAALLTEDNTFRVLDQPLTQYRQHDNNVLGFYSKMTDHKLKSVLKCREKHFRVLIDYCTRRGLMDMASRFAAQLDDELSMQRALSFSEFHSAMTYDEPESSLFWFEVKA